VESGFSRIPATSSSVRFSHRWRPDPGARQSLPCPTEPIACIEWWAGAGVLINISDRLAVLPSVAFSRTAYEVPEQVSGLFDELTTTSVVFDIAAQWRLGQWGPLMTQRCSSTHRRHCVTESTTGAKW
jgi:hypothetical protein